MPKKIINKLIKVLYESKLANNLGWNFIGKFGSAGINFIITTFLLFVLNVEDYGEYVVFFSIYVTIPFFLDLGINNSFISIGAKLKILSKDDYIKLVSSFFLIKTVTFLIVIFVLILGKWELTTLTVIFFGAVLGLWESILTIFKSSQNFKLLSKIIPIRNFLSLSGICFFYYVLKIEDWKTYLYIIMLSPLILTLIIYLFYFRKIKIKIYKEILGDIFLVSKWVAMFTLVNALYVKTDLFILKYFAMNEQIDDYQVGVFSAAVSLLSFLPVLTSTVSEALLPKVSEENNKDYFLRFIKNLKKTIPYMLVLLVVGLVILYFVFTYGFNKKYYDSVIPMIIIGFGMILTFYRNTLVTFFYPLGRTDLVFKTVMIMFLINIPLGFILVPSMGAIGASITSLIVILTGLVYTIYTLNKSLNRL